MSEALTIRKPRALESMAERLNVEPAKLFDTLKGSMNCPKCGAAIEPQQARAASARWDRLTSAERSAVMSRVRRKGIRKQKKGNK